MDIICNISTWPVIEGFIITPASYAIESKSENERPLLATCERAADSITAGLSRSDVICAEFGSGSLPSDRALVRLMLREARVDEVLMKHPHCKSLLQ